MKIKTQKKSKTILKFYVANYGFRKPYQVLLDGTLCQAAIKNQVVLRRQLPVYFEGDVKFLSTQCVLIELEKLGEMMNGAVAIIKQFGYHRCGHEDRPVSAYQCLKSMIGEKNKSRYVLGTQDYRLRVAARNVPGTPIIYLNGHTPVLEDPSILSRNYAHTAGQAKFLEPPKVIQLPQEPWEEHRKLVKRPNPLSCLKKKVKPVAPVVPKNEDGPKRKRKRIKLAKHLKEVKREMLEQAP